MSRLLLLLAIVLVVYLLVRSFRKNSTKNSTGKNTLDQDQVTAEDMVACAKCGIHLPKGESVQADGHFFCCMEHRDAHRK